MRCRPSPAQGSALFLDCDGVSPGTHLSNCGGYLLSGSTGATVLSAEGANTCGCGRSSPTEPEALWGILCTPLCARWAGSSIQSMPPIVPSTNPCWHACGGTGRTRAARPHHSVCPQHCQRSAAAASPHPFSPAGARLAATPHGFHMCPIRAAIASCWPSIRCECVPAGVSDRRLARPLRAAERATRHAGGNMDNALQGVACVNVQMPFIIIDG